MKWKDFLKLDRRKIVISLIIYFYLISIAFYVTCFGNFIRCEEGYEPYYDKSAMFLMRCSIPVCISTDLITFYNIKDFLLLAFVFLVLPYLISCLTVWIYDKFRKKSKK